MDLRVSFLGRFNGRYQCVTQDGLSTPGPRADRNGLRAVDQQEYELVENVGLQPALMDRSKLLFR